MSDGKIIISNTVGTRVVSQNLKRKIDQFLQKQALNEYGDPKGTVYAGGTPLFDERGGGYQDRYQYVLCKYPELEEEE